MPHVLYSEFRIGKIIFYTVTRALYVSARHILVFGRLAVFYRKRRQYSDKRRNSRQTVFVRVFSESEKKFVDLFYYIVGYGGFLYMVFGI